MNILAWFSWRPLGAVVLALSMCLLVSAASAEQEGRIRVVDDGSGRLFAEIDLASLPPELAGQLTAYFTSASDEETGSGFFEDDKKDKDDKKGKNKDEKKGKGKDDKKDKGKGDKQKEQIVTVDLNKLPPDLAKQLLKYLRDADKKGPEKGKGKDKGEAKGKDKGEGKGKGKGAEKKGGGKVISLEEAIAIAEKAGKGKAVKVERKGEGSDSYFKVEVVGKDGTKSKVELNARGERPETIGYPKMGPEKKGDKKPGKGKE